MSLTPHLKALVGKPPQFTPEHLAEVVRAVARGEASDIQVASVLTGMRLLELDRDPLYIATAARAILEFSLVVDPLAVDAAGYVDIVGTGGDGQNTFNVSTSAAIVAAGMGIGVCKHGGKALTLALGAGDIMTHLGVDLLKVDAEHTPAIVAKSKFCFLFAPTFHPAMKAVAPLRAGLGIPTIFNVLGPLLNPMPLRARIIGVYAEPLGQVFAEAVVAMDKMAGRPVGSTMVVWGECGLDEISPIGRTKVWRVGLDGAITASYISPADFGLPEHPLAAVASGTPQENAATLERIFSLTAVPEEDPLVDYIVMNAAALAVVSGAARDWKDGVAKARELITLGASQRALTTFVASAK